GVANRVQKSYPELLRLSQPALMIAGLTRPSRKDSFKNNAFKDNKLRDLLTAGTSPSPDFQASLHLLWHTGCYRQRR
ncbi:MAG: hypothetical protein JSU96_05885, partial [Acidobacteriota bacterium]